MFDTIESIDFAEIITFDRVICAAGLLLLARWLLTTSLGRKALDDSPIRRNNMPFYAPLIPLFIWFYFLDEMRALDIPYAHFNATVGYKPNAVPYGFTVLDEEKSMRIITKYDLLSEVHLPQVSEQEFVKAIDELEGLESLDSQGVTQFRVEQSFTRNYLFGKNRFFV